MMVDIFKISRHIFVQTQAVTVQPKLTDSWCVQTSKYIGRC